MSILIHITDLFNQEIFYDYIDKLVNIKDAYLSKAASVFIMLLFISIMALLVFSLSKIIIKILRVRIIRKSQNTFLHILAKDYFLFLFAHLVMALVFLGGSGFVIRHNYTYTSYLAIIISKLSQFYFFITLILIITKCIKALNPYYEQKYDFAHERPIISYLNVIIVCVWIIGFILIISFFSKKSPFVLLTGIGAVSAIFLLVFKDVLLGIVASIQVAALNIVKIDDRVSLDKYNVDGTIMNMTITTITIRNNDNTIVTIPTYMITSEILKNWRGVATFGARRIKRAIYLDIDSIKICDEVLLKKLLNLIDKLSLQVGLANFSLLSIDDNMPDNGSDDGIDNIDSKLNNHLNNNPNKSMDNIINLNLYRTYIELYLRHHSAINKEYPILLRHLAPTPNGLPIEIYAFTHQVIWYDYERIQANIFEYCFASLKEFELKVTQQNKMA